MPVPDKWDQITLGLIKPMVEIKTGAASPDAYGLNVGTVAVPEKKMGFSMKKGRVDGGTPTMSNTVVTFKVVPPFMTACLCKNNTLVYH